MNLNYIGILIVWLIKDLGQESFFRHPGCLLLMVLAH